MGTFKFSVNGNSFEVTVNEIENQALDMSALESVAIAAALHLYFDDVHDVESGVLTMKPVDRAYSPWNSKYYGFNNNFSR